MEERGSEDRAVRRESTTAVHNRITDAVFALDAEWQFTHIDERAEAAFGLENREVMGRSIWLVVPELAGSAFQDCCLDAIDRQRTVRVEQPLPSAETVFEMRIYPSETGVTVCVRDVTGESAVDARSERAVAETITDAVLTIDADSTIRRANSATEDVFGYTAAELVGESLTKLMPASCRVEHQAALERYLETGERQIDWRSVEMPGRRKDGEEIELSISFAAHSATGDPRFTGVIRDVTERKRRERALREAHDVIADGSLSLAGQIEALLSIGRTAMGTEFATLSTVRGDEYLFESVVAPDDADLSAGDTVPLDATNCERVLSTGETLVLDDIAADAPELVDRAGNAALGTACYLGTTVSVDGMDQGTFCFFGSEPRSEPFSDWQVAFTEHLAAWIGKELERKRYVDRLTALDELNQVVRAVTDEAISQPTREEIERRTCEAIAATDSYLFAWIGEADPGSQTVEPRAEAGVDGYTESVSISIDPENPESDGPTGRAFRTGEVQTIRNVGSDPSYSPWQDTADEYGFRSSAAIPVEHEGTVYGVLNVYTDRSDAFTSEEYDVIGLLGKIVGHAIASVDRKQVLLADAVVDLEFRVTDAFSSFDVTGPSGAPIRLNAVVPRDDDEYVVFGAAGDEGFAVIESLIETGSHWKEVLHTRETEDGIAFEVLLEEPPMLTAISAADGRFVEAVIDDGDLRVRVQLPNDADTREVLDAVRESYPETTLVSKQEVDADEVGGRHDTRVALDDLTERRLEALRTAYHAGYFEWPRDTSGEEVADLLDISSPTFSQHLRAAEQSVFERLFDHPAGE